MQSKVINEIHEELEKFERTKDQKHVYAIERLLLLLKEDDSNNEEEKEPKVQQNKKKKSLDGLYLAEEKSSSIFDF